MMEYLPDPNRYMPEIASQRPSDDPVAAERRVNVTLRLPTTLQRRLAALAKGRGVSLNEWMVENLRAVLDEMEGNSTPLITRYLEY
jgi:hypothetical protein